MAICYTVGIGHGSRAMDDHSLILSLGAPLWCTNYRLAVSPHQWLPSTDPSITFVPPTFECCHIQISLLILCKHIVIFFRDEVKEWHYALAPPYEETFDWHWLWLVGEWYMSTIWRKAVEWYRELAGLGNHSPTATNHSGDVYHQASGGPDRLENWMETICSEEVQAN
jgi:hypothetical protein